MACINRTLNHTGFWAPYASDHALILPSATNSPLSHFAFAPDERHFCLCSHDGVRLYELKMKREFCSAVDIGCMAYQVAVAPNGATVAIDAGDRLMQMDISGEGGVSPLNAELGSRSEFARHDLCYSADNQWLVTSGGYGNGQISIVAQGQRDGKAVTRITLEEYRGIYDFKPNYMAGFGWNDSGFLIAAASGQLLMWDLNGDTPQEISRSVSNGIRYRAITLSGREGFAVATDDTGATLIQRLDCSNSKISLTGHYDIACPGAPTSCTSSPSGTTLVVGDDTGAITVADVTDTPSAYQTIDGHDGAVCDVVWCGNSRVVSGAADGLTVWGIDDDSLAPEYQIPVSGAVSSVAVSPDGARVFVTCTGSSLVREIDIEAIDRKLQELGLNSEGISVSNLHSFE